MLSTVLCGEACDAVVWFEACADAETLVAVGRAVQVAEGAEAAVESVVVGGARAGWVPGRQPISGFPVEGDDTLEVLPPMAGAGSGEGGRRVWREPRPRRLPLHFWGVVGSPGWVARVFSAAFRSATAPVVPRGLRVAPKWEDASPPPCVRLDVVCTEPVGPGMQWERRMFDLYLMTRKLMTSVAYISTLGGGRYMCRHVGHARRLAALQRKAATYLGDPSLAAKCLVHFIYIDIQEGKFEDAAERIAALRGDNSLVKDAGLHSMLDSADVYLANMTDLHARGGPASPASPLHDDFYRQRIVVPDGAHHK